VKRLTITDAASMALGLQDEIRRSEESRYDHRLHGVLLVAQGMSCPDVAGLLGDATRSVENWVRRFEKSGLAGLREGEHSGRPQCLNVRQVAKINVILRQTPRDAGLSQNLWDGKALSAWIQREYGVSLGVRQCQRLFRRLDFRLRKPRPLLGKGDPAVQQQHKKNSKR
jgi:transposase